MRLIPAHTGKTHTIWWHHRRRRAHPHSRGEDESTATAKGISQDSSPVTWGRRRVRQRLPDDERLIPAYSGKTVRRRHTLRSRRVHPHSRGENAAVSCASYVCTGSSPLTQGKRSAPGRGPRKPWLIPAHAGKTQTRPGWHPQAGAHPRSRGENTFTFRVSSLAPGSSPLTRGKHNAHRSLSALGGLIPAHAGKTSLP